MAKAEEEHRSAVKARTEHTRSSGCIVRCETNYVDKHPHSHRWQAAEKARRQKDVYTLPMGPKRFGNWSLEMVQELQSAGALVGKFRKQGEYYGATLKPFVRAFAPFPHNAHHIIPMSVLWNDVIKVAVAKATSDPDKMLNLVIGGFLTEPYNHNGRPNMVLLPTADSEARALGLPKHLEEAKRNHPDYSDLVTIQVATVPEKYDGLANDLNAGKHDEELSPVKVRPQLERISKAIYEALIAIAKANRGKLQTLDEAVSDIATTMSPAAAR